MASFDRHEHNALAELAREQHRRQYPVSSEHFMATIAANVDNERVSDAEFRAFLRNSLPIVDYPRPEKR